MHQMSKPAQKSALSLCTVSAIEILKPVVFVLLGVTNITGWYFTELQPKLRREGKYKKIEAGLNRKTLLNNPFRSTKNTQKKPVRAFFFPLDHNYQPVQSLIQ
jgi:hypothetical protein